MKNKKKIWVDLDNSPHVLFFNPIIRELKKRGYTVVITVRNHAQVCGLADMFHLKYTQIGRHYGKNRLMKVLGVFIRSLQMVPYVYHHKPDMAFSHGSRSQFFLSELFHMPYATAFDYEHSRSIPFVNPTMAFMPEVIPKEAVKKKIKHILRYPGIKEDVYVPDFKPDARIKEELGLNETSIIATVRPPAMDAHYQNPESGTLFKSVINFLGSQDNIRIVMLPRIESQAEFIKKEWPNLFAEGKMIIPEHVVNGLNLIWHSDLVLSGGGTLIREAAALNVPAYSFFRGKTGAVDRYLTDSGRMTMIESVEHIKDKIKLRKKQNLTDKSCGNNTTIQYIVKRVVEMIEGNVVTG
jgi:hypothetical protein